MRGIIAICTVGIAVAGALGIDSARPSAAQAFSTESGLNRADSIPLGSRHESYGFSAEPKHTAGNLVRPQYGAYECTTDEGYSYRWPCSRPETRY